MPALSFQWNISSLKALLSLDFLGLSFRSSLLALRAEVGSSGADGYALYGGMAVTA